MSLGTWRLRRGLRSHLHDGEQWLAAARELSGSWWVVTDQALIVATPAGQPTQRIPRAELIDIRAKAPHQVRVRTAKERYLVGSFQTDDVAEALGADR